MSSAAPEWASSDGRRAAARGAHLAGIARLLVLRVRHREGYPAGAVPDVPSGRLLGPAVAAQVRRRARRRRRAGAGLALTGGGDGRGEDGSALSTAPA